MRRLKPNDNGQLVEQSDRFLGAAPMHAYREPSYALTRINKIKANERLLISVCRFQGGLGDVLMTLPTVKAIKQKYNCELHYVTNFEYLDGALPNAVLHNPYVDQIIDFRNHSPEQYDAVVDLTCPCVVHEQPLAPPINRIDLFARHAGIELLDKQIDYVITQEERDWAISFLEEKNLLGRKLILVQPNSSTELRDLSISKLQKALVSILSSSNNLRAIILGHGHKSINDPNWNLQNILEIRDLKVRQIAAVMELCEIVLCQDSSILHLAGALNKKCLSFFGPTDPRARVNHYPNAIALWYGVDLACAPSWYKNDACRGQFYCWKLFEENLIAETAVAMINNTNLPDSKYIIRG